MNSSSKSYLIYLLCQLTVNWWKDEKISRDYTAWIFLYGNCPRPSMFLSHTFCSRRKRKRKREKNTWMRIILAPKNPRRVIVAIEADATNGQNVLFCSFCRCFALYLCISVKMTKDWFRSRSNRWMNSNHVLNV